MDKSLETVTRSVYTTLGFCRVGGLSSSKVHLTRGHDKGPIEPYPVTATREAWIPCAKDQQVRGGVLSSLGREGLSLVLRRDAVAAT